MRKNKKSKERLKNRHENLKQGRVHFSYLFKRAFCFVLRKAVYFLSDHGFETQKTALHFVVGDDWSFMTLAGFNTHNLLTQKPQRSKIPAGMVI